MELFEKSLKSGMSGAGAMVVQVGSLMWMRTIMNHQYRYGKSVSHTIRQLYTEGGIPRFYRGITPALVQGPLSRFGDTFSNTLALQCLKDYDAPIPLKTAAASITAGLFRIFLMPVDTLKTFLQVEGEKKLLAQKFKVGGIRVLYHGALATSTATVAGHYPWFATYNFLDSYIPRNKDNRNLRNAFIGFVSSIVSDTVSNSFRVIKTTKQTFPESISYTEAVKTVVAKDGVVGLFGRGLKIRLVTNGVQGLVFSVLWKHFQGEN
jgi:hypothetical protein